MKDCISRFLRDHSAVASIEYALLGALIAIVILGSVTTVGTQLLQLYVHVKDQVVLAIK